MLIRIGYDIAFENIAPTPTIMLLYVHPSRAQDVQGFEMLKIDPWTPVTDYYDTFGNRCARAFPPGIVRITNDAVVRDSGELDEINVDAPLVPVQELPSELLQFLMSSRYCEVDRMLDMAWKLFADTPPTYQRVQAICTWVNQRIEFGYHHARNTRTAAEACEERKGVCRDFTHLAVTLCRCMNIPARYVTGYLGDIGVPSDPNPMDFSAWFEAYVGGKWYTFDPRHNERRIGRILMAKGRDAVDVALTTSFSNSKLVDFKVWTDEVPSQT